MLGGPGMDGARIDGLGTDGRMPIDGDRAKGVEVLGTTRAGGV